ncbi:hypothetical protein MIZ03_3221 [Rhodoferax lithotrophicus]|uniref:Uncharacterized protein n=1 Tax=Rhodoferax lithotrophicus TaxID=2798804 RepID=A0ABN6DBZ4_9BURK|nr:hypothetical protein MIZ03_3221 [Rhodoferax sp. MIZ03]
MNGIAVCAGIDWAIGLKHVQKRNGLVVVGCEAVAGISPLLASHFLSFHRKKVTKERATPLSATRSDAAGNLSCDGWAGNRSNSLRSDNRGSFSRPTVTTQAQPEGTQNPVLVALRATLHWGAWHTPRCNARRSRASSAVPYAVVRRRVAQGWADQGTRLSERSEFERPPAQTEQRSEPARSDGDAFGSPFFWVLFFGEAKKSASPAGARPGQQAHPKQKKELS